MKSDQGNNFTLYVGIVLEDKASDSTNLKVNLREMLPFESGEVAVKESSVTSVTSTNQSGEVTLANYIEAKYFNIIPNRRYPPDVKKNEQVFVFRYADGDNYYWVPLGREDFLRRTERLNFSVSNTPTAVDVITNDNSYSLELDTINGHVAILTSTSNGEQFAYGIKIDTVNSKVIIGDSNTNEIVLDSTIPRIYLKNVSGSIIDMTKESITINAPNDVIIRSGRQIVLDSPTITTNATNNIVNVTNNSINASGNSQVEASTIGLNGSVTANEIVSGPVIASGYTVGAGMSTGSSSMTRSVVTPTEQYTPATSNIITGTSTSPDNSPNNVDINSGRYCCSWEEMEAAINYLSSAINQLDGIVGAGVGGLTSSADTSAASSIMHNNRGA